MNRMLLLAIPLLVASLPAFAADEGTRVALTDILTGLVALVGGVALAIARPVAAATCQWFETLTRIRLDDSQRALLDSLCLRGIDYATGVLNQRIAAGQPTLDLHSATLAAAADYVLAHAPEAAAHFGLDRDSIVRMVMARLDVSPSVAVPATPPLCPPPVPDTPSTNALSPVTA